MAAGQRAFVTKLNKRGAAEVRKHVSSAYLGDINKGSSGSSASPPVIPNIPLCDVVEPPDYEELISHYQGVLDRDPLRPVLEFPPDDIQVEVVRRQVRTIAPVIPERGYEADRHVRDCVRYYTKDYPTIVRKYAKCSCQHVNKDERAKRLHGVPCQEYEMHHISDSSHKKLSSFSTSSDSPSTNTASSVTDLKNSQSDPLVQTLLESTPNDTIDANNKAERQKNRHDAIFCLYPTQPEDDQIEYLQPVLPPAEQRRHRLLVKCLQLKLEMEIEPIFASMALYNIKERKKISESFYFDMTSEPIKKMLDAHVPYHDVPTLSRSCIFEMAHPSPDVFLVVKLEKVLQQGDISEVAEAYMKDDKNRERARQNAAFYCERLGKYRMPFAWTAVYLMSVINQANTLESEKDLQLLNDSADRRPGAAGQYDSMRKSSLDRPKSGTPDKRDSWNVEELGNALDSFRPVTLTISSFFKQESDKLSDDDLYKNLHELKKPSVSKKLKCLPGSLKLDVSPCPAEVKNCLTAEHYKIDPYLDDNVRPIKEIVEFPIREIYEPYTAYRNLLYVLPKSLNFASRQGSARNLAVKVTFMATEDEQQAMPIIFGKSSCPEYAKEMYTTVCYHNKTPSFYDEVKIRLPARLGDGHHLLFTLYHVSCQRKGEQGPSAGGQLETVVGYTWLPLMRDGRLLTGEFCLPVSVEKPPAHYSMLHPEVMLPQMKWVDNHKGLFTVVIEAVTSIHTLDDYLDRFLNLVHAAENAKIPTRVGEANFESELKRAIGDLSLARVCPLIRFLPLILDKLLLLTIQPPVVGGQVVNVGQLAFEAIAQIVKRLQNILELKFDKHGHNTILTTYIHYSCTLPHPDMNQISPTSGASPGASANNFATLGRPATLAIHKAQRQLSSSDPDLTSSNPTSPENEMALLSGTRTIDRGMRQELQSALYPKLYSKKLVHEELVLQWLVSSGTTRELSLSNAWFFFDLIIKSMSEYVTKSERPLLSLSRKLRFSKQFIDDVQSLFSLIARDIIDRYAQDLSMIRNLNMSLAFFVNGCLSLLDRGFVFHLIKSYCKLIVGHIESCAGGSNQDITSLLSLKLDFMRVVCSHEHYLALNLPVSLPVATPASGPPSPTTSLGSSTSQSSLSTMSLNERGLSTELTGEFRVQHFLTGIILSDLATMIPQQQLHTKAINIVCNLLSSHDLDPRYASAEAKARIATLYLPLVTIVIDALPQLYDPAAEARNAQLQTAAAAAAANDDNSRGIDQNVAMAIAGSSVYGVPGESSSAAGKKCSLGADATQDLLICFLWVLKNIDQRILWSWWSEMSPPRLGQLLDVLFLCQSNFEYKGKPTVRLSAVQAMRKNQEMKARMEEYILGPGSARSEMMKRRMNESSTSLPTTSTAVESSGRVRWRKDQTQWRTALADSNERRLRDENECFVEGLLSAEVSLLIIDTIELITQIIRSSDNLLSLLSCVLRTLLHCLSLNQSSYVLQCMFASQRSLVAKFPELLFEEDTEQCADLCLRLLRHCSSSLTSVRAHASASLYMLMRQNFEIGNNFARVKMQVTMSLSSLVGQSQTFNEEYLRTSLKTILVYAEVDTEFHSTTFPDQVRDLVFNLHMILSDTIKMKEFQEDPEMLIDLMYRIAKGYQNSPDLRLTWLQSMASKHAERGNNAESAMCLVHSASLVAEYLTMLEDRVYLPVGCVSFQHISRNVLEESAVSEDVVSPDEEGICTGKFFSELGLVGLIEQAASSFHTAGLYEAINLVYKVLVPIYEHNRDFKRLSLLHGKLHAAFDNVAKQEGKRMFGTYFRVGFYGSRFGDLDSQEFVYKEPAITKLPEISHRLESFYAEKFGQDAVEIVKDSNTVEREKLDPTKAYIQITYVEPYFDLYELRDRVTFFDKNYDIKRFMYETPFTKDGRAHGELKDQYKRKTILTTSHSFPYIKTRLTVVSREQMVLTPIEVAIEDIQKKTRELALAYRQDPPHPKMLQMVLQGCIGTTVNQGPVEMATVFLKVPPDEDVSSKHHNKLRICFKDFLKKCGDTLQKNKSLIGNDQRDYQRELERNYHQIKDQLSPLIAPPIASDTRKKHKRRTQKTL